MEQMRLVLPLLAPLRLVSTWILQMTKTRMTQTLLFRLGVVESCLLLGFQYLSMAVHVFPLLAGFGCHVLAQRNQFAQTCSIWPLIFLWSFQVASFYHHLHILARCHPLLPCAAVLITIQVQERPTWRCKFQFNP